MGALEKLLRPKKRKKYATGGVGVAPPVTIPKPEEGTGRAYTPMADNADYYHYGEGPEHQFFSGQLKTEPLKVGLPTPPTGPSTQGSSGGTKGLLGAVGDIGTIGSLLQYGEKGANMLGYDNAFTQGMGSAGDTMSNPLKSGLDYLTGGGGASLASIGSGAAASGALDAAGITGSASQAAADIFAEQAALQGTGAAGGAGASTGAGAGAAGTAGLSGAAAGGLGMALVAAYSQLVNQRGDENRNMSAFNKAYPDLVTKQQFIKGPGRGYYILKNGKKISTDQFENLAGSWYGATYAPDGDQSGWQKKYQDLLNEYGVSDLLGHAHGGAIEQMLGAKSQDPKFLGTVKGPGTGRSDDIPARLSDGEYVIDAETVALLGDGSTDAGARRLDRLRERVRKDKGRKLAQGKFSDNAKDASAYLRGK